MERKRGNIMKKALILIGSPRKKGKYRQYSQQKQQRGLKEQGVEPETIFLNDLKSRAARHVTGAEETILRNVR